MSARGFMSIGEVLTALKPDFPDASVSKIRFLEAEGLISPERTASGYRKFHARDLDRLRFILKLQRDSFLPLKVIRERLAQADEGALPVPESGAAPSTATAQPPVAPAAATSQTEDAEDELAEPSSVTLTEADLATKTGLEPAQIRELREFGVLCEHAANGHTYFDGDDLTVGLLARDFMRLGLEPRHLKTLKRFAEQEADLFGQLVVPSMRNRRPDVRKQAADTVVELARLSRRLRTTYVRQSLRATINGDG